MGACITGQADIAELLLEHKATVDYKDKVFILAWRRLASSHLSMVHAEKLGGPGDEARVR